MSHAGHSHGHNAVTNLRLAFFLNVGFTILEVAGGLWTNSIAILSDALHDGGDCFSLGLAWYLQRVAARQPTDQFTYGYRRFSSLGALVTGLVLVIGLSVVAWNSFQRLRSPEEVHATGMLGMAVLGILVNGAAAWKLQAGSSLNEKIASWHLIEDTLGWVAVLLASILMMIWDIPILDPLIAIGIAGFVVWNVVRNLRKVMLVFLQSAPADFDVVEFEKRVREIPGVVGSHHTHTWTLDGEHHVLSTHLVMRPGSGRDEIVSAKRRVHEVLREQHFEHITVEVELDGETCTGAECEPVRSGVP